MTVGWRNRQSAHLVDERHGVDEQLGVAAVLLVEDVHDVTPALLACHTVCTYVIQMSNVSATTIGYYAYTSFFSPPPPHMNTLIEMRTAKWPYSSSTQFISQCCKWNRCACGGVKSSYSGIMSDTAQRRGEEWGACVPRCVSTVSMACSSSSVLGSV